MPLDYSVDLLYEQDFAVPITVRASQVLGPISRHRVSDMLHVKLVSLFCASFATSYARLKNFTPRIMNKCVLDAPVNMTLSHITTSVLVSMVHAVVGQTLF